jgi:hypothetical protein
MCTECQLLLHRERRQWAVNLGHGQGLKVLRQLATAGLDDSGTLAHTGLTLDDGHCSSLPSDDLHEASSQNSGMTSHQQPQQQPNSMQPQQQLHTIPAGRVGRAAAAMLDLHSKVDTAMNEALVAITPCRIACMHLCCQYGLWCVANTHETQLPGPR